MNHIIGRTKNGFVVYIDLIKSPAANYVSHQPRLLELARKICSQTDVTTATVRLESNLGKPIGYNQVVETSDSDVILYAQQQREDVFSRFVKNGKPATTNYLSLVLRRDDNGDYSLHQLWLGRLRPPRPGSSDETVASRDYWASHAFILDTHNVQPRTATKVCPY